MNSHILIVEDEFEVAKSLGNFLSKAGFDVSHVERGDQVLPWLEKESADLILLDIMLPGLNGMEVCQKLRATSDVPIFMLTACAEETQRLQGFELGADDYITKPFSAPEVVLRVKNFLKRFGQTTAKRSLELDQDLLSAFYDGKPVDFTRAEFELVSLLHNSPNQAFSREQILNAIYSDYRIVTDRTVDTHIKNVRKKLKSVSPQHEFIQAVYGVGYRFVLEVFD